MDEVITGYAVNPHLAFASTASGTALFDTIPALLRVLDEVAQIHPFIQGFFFVIPHVPSH